MKIIITGTPGTGKTTIAKKLAKKLKIPYISLTEIAKKIEENGECDVRKLEKILELPEKYVLEGHLACEFKIDFDIIIVLRCPPQELKKRLEKRGYSKSKIAENLYAEALDYCALNSEKNYGKVAEVSTNKTIQETLKQIMDIINNKSEGEKIDYSSWIVEGLDEGKKIN